MKTLMICMSFHKGNTRKVAEAMARELKCRVAEPSEVDPKELAQYELVGFGSGIYGSRHHTGILELADSLPEMKGKKAFIFSTSGSPPEKLGKHRPLRERLEEKGLKVVGEFSSRGFTTWAFFRLWGGSNKGRPHEGDLERAREFARGLSRKK